ncbi:hypothetical protein CK203_028775 [Vitis vinifera]|uniref:Uncharacterized protein n=1 Tax=Vitis vinifera TaxID=29760 RepID=A0A438IFK5_VITVI|nr:hypothetical protein CK203_028775 [Vitis vinifera]
MGNCVVPGDLHSLTMFEELVKCSVCFEYMNRPIYQFLGCQERGTVLEEHTPTSMHQALGSLGMSLARL